MNTNHLKSPAAAKGTSLLIHKIHSILKDIHVEGSASITRLTVLKKWFDRPSRIRSFAIYMAKLNIKREGKITDKEKKLLRAADRLFFPLEFLALTQKFEKKKAEELYDNLRSYQNEFIGHGWRTARQIHNWRLFCIEQGLEILLYRSKDAQAAYRLASCYCENYNPRYGNSLNGPSQNRIKEIIWFINMVETSEAIKKADV